MEIYVYDNEYFLGNNPPREIIKYKSEIVPRINEHIYLAHYGSYKVTNVVYHCSDEGNIYKDIFEELMWVEVYVEKVR